MKYVCIKCRESWLEGTDIEIISGSLCDPCITQYIRAKQIERGYLDCFRQNIELCSAKKCDYWQACNKYYLSELVHGEEREAEG
jgi:hypothetical protein